MALSKQQLKNRKIGGSSSAAAMGLSKYKRPEELRREISYSMHGRDAIYKWVAPALGINDITIMPEELSEKLEEAVDLEESMLTGNLDNIHIRVGTFLEDFVRTRLKNMGINIRKKTQHMVHPDYPFITANIDGRESDTVEEIKCISVYRKNEFGDEYTNEAAPDYTCQIDHYMLFPQFKHGKLRVLFLSESEKELVDRMIRSMIIKYIDKQDVVLGDELIEFQIPRYGAVLMNTEKREEYRADSCSMNLDVIQNLVDIAPLKTYEFHKDIVTGEKLINAYKDFWHRASHNIPCIPSILEDCQLLYEGYNSSTSKIAGDLEKRLSAERNIINIRMKTDKDRMADINSELMIEAGESDIVLGAGGKPLFKIGQKWSSVKDKSALVNLLGIDDIGKYYKNIIDWELVEKDIPDIYQKCRVKSARNIQWPRKK